ncbi:protein-glutamate methylesterase/protein-glutamine glutaminase [Tissierella praeacuta]|uniref:protein-glutamate methylesterase/protein-glutamine glutaminase n=1 Tax=Tissierella praeacuta TaxID=43131 RepID=UPI001C12728C|nr:chemotaxis response regulator protein-glutamate methylesterase [Tissierella praeacuta]MBU5254776.1 chemotaxis response regulator protein-glutamate methylesterase [Tissierella praeacuta]
MIKVLIVDDSALIRKILTDILTSDTEISVVGTARNGQEALEKIEVLKPDIVTLDIEMPLMDGLTTLKHIVSKHSKLPVIMISSLTSEGAELTLKALDEGAVDFLPKPTNIFSLSQVDIKKEIIEKIKVGAKSKFFVRQPIKKINAMKEFKDRSIVGKEKFDNIVAIGTSTGGPRALQTLIPELPSNINAAILIVQHMPPKFTKSLADRLNSISNIRIKEAEDGDILSKGWGYIAPGDYHMTVIEESKDLVIRLNKEPQVMGLRPTVDKMMESVAEIRGYSKTGIILTGMGSDGAKGIVKMRQSGSYTIAQDESTSVVYGMPKSAIATNCVDIILPIDKIASKIIDKVGV